MSVMEKGLVHIYCGNGKGKTTAAMGLAVRASGRDKKVLITQFLKDNESGEITQLEKLSNIDLFKGDPVKKFVKFMSPEEIFVTKNEHKRRFLEVTKKAVDENYDLLIMDEIIAATNLELINLDDVIDFLKNRPVGLEVVMTGRNPNEKLIEIADYVSEMTCIKHPYDKGINARIGIEK